MIFARTHGEITIANGWTGCICKMQISINKDKSGVLQDESGSRHHIPLMSSSFSMTPNRRIFDRSIRNLNQNLLLN